MRKFENYLEDLRATELGKTPLVLSLAQAGIRLPIEVQQDLPTALKRYPWIDDIIRELVELATEAGGLADIRRIKTRLAPELKKSDLRLGAAEEE